jgi:hypothetical protein
MKTFYLWQPLIVMEQWSISSFLHKKGHEDWKNNRLWTALVASLYWFSTPPPPPPPRIPLQSSSIYSTVRAPKGEERVRKWWGSVEITARLANGGEGRCSPSPFATKPCAIAPHGKALMFPSVLVLAPRKYWMIYRGPGFLAVVLFGTSPIPLLSFSSHKLSPFLTEGGMGWERSKVIRPRDWPFINHALPSSRTSPIILPS